jgi:enoyl-CoA hydratase
MPVTIEKSGAVWTVILSRPEARNAVNPETATRLYETFLAFDRDGAASVAVFTGDAGVFCAGFDLKVAAKASEQQTLSDLAFPKHDDGGALRGPMGPTRLELTKPVIAAIEGPAVAGGMELALWCDMRVMATSAYMGVYCRRWGVPLIDGGTVRLPRLVGEGRARHHFDRPQGDRRRMLPPRPLRASSAGWRSAPRGRGSGAGIGALAANMSARRPPLYSAAGRQIRARGAQA